MDIGDSFGFVNDTLFGQIFIVFGVLAGMSLLRRSQQHYRRVCQEHGAALAACGLTGQLTAQRLLAACGLSNVPVVRSRRRNYYHMWKRQIALNAMTFESPSMLAVTTAAHEVGHAQQFAKGIFLTRVRRVFVPIAYVLLAFIVGAPLLLISGVVDFPMTHFFPILLTVGGVALLVPLSFHLPLEYDASRRARKLLDEVGLIQPNERFSRDAILKAAWWTHAAQQAQGWVAIAIVGLSLLFLPSFGAPEPKTESAAPPVVATRPEAPIRAPTPQPRVQGAPSTEPQSLDELYPYNAIATLTFDTTWVLHLLLSCVPLVIMYLFVSRLCRPGRVVARSPAERAIVCNNAGLALIEQGKLTAAICKYDEALRLDPSLGAVYYNRGQILLRLGRSDEALADFDATLRITPKYAYAIAARGEVWALRKDYDRALNEYDTALALAPENPTLLSMRGFARVWRNELDAALADFNSALQFNPKEALAHRGRATVAVACREFDRALAEIDQAIALGNREADTFTLCGQIWFAKNDLPQAIDAFTTALQRDPCNAAALRDRGHAWLRQDQLDRALADLNEAIRLNPADAVAFNNRGAAKLQAGDYAGAILDLREAIRIDPKLPNPYKHLAWLQATCPQPEFRDGAEAIANATNALELADWKQTEWLAVLAAAYAEAGDFETAVRWQAKCLEEAPAQDRGPRENALKMYEARHGFRDCPAAK